MEICLHAQVVYLVAWRLYQALQVYLIVETS